MINFTKTVYFTKIATEDNSPASTAGHKNHKGHLIYLILYDI
jgi:hypothetical protein